MQAVRLVEKRWFVNQREMLVANGSGMRHEQPASCDHVWNARCMIERLLWIQASSASATDRFSLSGGSARHECFGDQGLLSLQRAGDPYATNAIVRYVPGGRIRGD